MTIQIKAGSTSRKVEVTVLDIATGLPYNTAAFGDAGISLWYRRGVTGAKTAITPATQTVTGAYSSGGFVLVGNGRYRLDLPDAALAAGVDEVEIGGGATAWHMIAPTVQLVGYDPRTELTTAVLAFIDASINSRSTYAGTDTGGTTTLLSRITALLQTKAEADTAHGLLATAAALVTAQADLDEIQTHLPAGVVASSTEVVAIQNNTRVVRVVPTVIERPDAGTTTYRVELLLYDETGNMETPDSAPTIALVNQAGTDLSARLDSPTMALVSTGRYRAIYTASLTDDLEQLVWAFSVVEGGNTRVYGNTTLIVDTTAVDFTVADRVTLGLAATAAALATAQADLDELQARLPSDPADASVVAGQITAAQAAVTAAIGALPDVPSIWSGITATAARFIADHTLRRSWASAAASANGDALSFRSLLGAVAKLVNRVGIVGTTLSVYQDDDTTVLGTQTVTSDAAAEPVTGVNTN